LEGESSLKVGTIYNSVPFTGFRIQNTSAIYSNPKVSLWRKATDSQHTDDTRFAVAAKNRNSVPLRLLQDPFLCRVHWRLQEVEVVEEVVGCSAQQRSAAVGSEVEPVDGGARVGRGGGGERGAVRTVFNK
jgi:hypothetical protein